jgi:hypothetical protein
MKNNVPGSGCINHDCDECVNRRAQPEPAAPTVVQPIGFTDPEELKRLAVANGQSIWVESWFVNHEYPPAGYVPLYTNPPRTALTRERALALWADKSDIPSVGEIVSYCRAIERAHGIGKAVTP